MKNPLLPNNLLSIISQTEGKCHYFDTYVLNLLMFENKLLINTKHENSAKYCFKETEF